MTFHPYRQMVAAGIVGPQPIRALERINGFTSSQHGQVVRGKDIWVDKGLPLSIIHDDFRLEDCRIVFRGGPGLGIYGLSIGGGNRFRGRNLSIHHISPPGDLSDYVTPPPFVTLEDFNSSHAPPPVRGKGGYWYDKIAFPNPNLADYTAMQEAVTVHDVDDFRLYGTRIFNASVGVLAANCLNPQIGALKNVNARGPYYRGQAVQFDHCIGGRVRRFYFYSDPLNTWDEDTISFYVCEDCEASDGLIDGNYAPLGVCLMSESSIASAWRRIVIVNYGNGGGSAYNFNPANPLGRDAVFDNVYMRDGHADAVRGNNASGGAPLHSFFVTGTQIIGCKVWGIPAGAGPNLESDTVVFKRAANGGAMVIGHAGSITGPIDVVEEDFPVPDPLEVEFKWQDWTGGPFQAALNVGPAQFKPAIDETAAPGTFVGQLDALSNDPAETFTWSLLDGADKVEIYNTNKVRTIARQRLWDDASINPNDNSRYDTIDVRCTGSRFHWIDRPCPITINPIDQIGVGVFNGSGNGVVGSGGSLATGWTVDKSAGFDVEVLEADVLRFPLRTQKLRLTASAVLGERYCSIFYPNGIPSLPAANGDHFVQRVYMCRVGALTLFNTGITMIEHTDLGVTVAEHQFGTGLNADLFSPEARLTVDQVLNGGVTTTRVTGQIYLSFKFTQAELDAGVTSKTQDIIIGAPRLMKKAAGQPIGLLLLLTTVS